MIFRCKIIWLFFALSLGLIKNGFSQKRIEDSLKLVIKTSSNDTNKIKALISLSLKCLQSGRNDTAIILIDQFKPLSEKLNYEIGIGKAYYYSAIIQQNQGKDSLALKNYSLATQIFKQVKFYKGSADIHCSIGRIYQKKGDFTGAEKEYSLSLEAFKSINEKTGIGRVYIQLGSFKYVQSKLPEALEYYRSAMKIYKELNDLLNIGNCHINISNVYEKQANHEDALNELHKSLPLFKQVGAQISSATALNNIANIYKTQANYPLAFGYYNEALKTFEKIGYQMGIAACHTNMGLIYKEQYNAKEALFHTDLALKIYEELNYKIGIATTYNNRGLIYKLSGNYTEALNNFIASVKVAEEVHFMESVADGHDNIGNLYLVNYNDPLSAQKHYLTALDIYENAENPFGVLNVNINLASCYEHEKKYDKSIEHSKKAFEINKKIKGGHESEIIEKNLYAAYNFTNQYDSARKYLLLMKNSINTQLEKNYYTMSEYEKELYFVNASYNFGAVYDFSSLRYKQYPELPDTCYNLALRTKGLCLKSVAAMRTAIANSKDTALIHQYENWISLKKQMTQVEQSGEDHRELSLKVNEIEVELIRKASVFDNFDKVKKLTWQQIQKKLKKNEAAIEFVNFKTDADSLFPVVYAAMVITKNSEHPGIIRLCVEDEINSILSEVKGNDKSVVGKLYGTSTIPQLMLYEKVWKPLESRLNGIKTIYYSPDGLLHKVSFAAINVGKNDLLCDKYNLYQLSSTGEIALEEELGDKTENEVMLVGDVKYTNEDTSDEIWTNLPETQKEIEEIKTILAGKKFKVSSLTAGNASEENVKLTAPNSHYVHVATHGFFFPDPSIIQEEQKLSTVVEDSIKFRGNGNYANWSFVSNKNPLMRSGVVLAGANDVWQRKPMEVGEDGILTAHEVSMLDMHKTRLVVLSACETGLGDIKGSEGVYGLQRALKMAGVKNIIMSLWQVPDLETSEFMIGFYKRLSKRENIKQAFNETQMEMRKKYDPYFWAAFVLLE